MASRKNKEKKKDTLRTTTIIDGLPDVKFFNISIIRCASRAKLSFQKRVLKLAYPHTRNVRALFPVLREEYRLIFVILLRTHAALTRTYHLRVCIIKKTKV